jgi:acetylornithine deacetylase/succinyl-diaminopimelate desuccinylase-like protein
MTDPSAIEDEVIEVTRRLIAAPSENPPGDERTVAGVIVDLLGERGIDRVETIASHPSRPNLIAHAESGQPGPTLILCGHVDTKPAGDLELWAHDPFAGEIAHDRLYGLGACDMKGGVASIIVAMGRLRASQTFERGSVLAAFTADEEAGSALGARHLAESGYMHGDAAIITEPAGIVRDWQCLHLGTRGSLLFRVDMDGARGHSSLEDHVPGTSATMAAARLMVRLDEVFRELDGVAVNVGATIAGGVHYGVRPGSASFRGDLRFPPGISQADVAAVLDTTVADFLSTTEDVGARITLDEISAGPFEPLALPPQAPVVEACRAAAAQALGRAPPDGVYPGGTDSFFLQGMAGIPTVPAFGPGCLREAHQPNEYVSLESLRAAPAMLVSAVERFLAE